MERPLDWWHQELSDHEDVPDKGILPAKSMRHSPQSRSHPSKSFVLKTTLIYITYTHHGVGCMEACVAMILLLLFRLHHRGVLTFQKLPRHVYYDYEVILLCLLILIIIHL